MKQIQFRQQTDIVEEPKTGNVFGVYCSETSNNAVTVFELSDDEVKKIVESKRIYIVQDIRNGLRLLEVFTHMKNAGIPITGYDWLSLLSENNQERYLHDIAIRWPNENVNETALKNSYSSFKEFILVSLGISSSQIDDGWMAKVSEWEQISNMHENIKL